MQRCLIRSRRKQLRFEVKADRGATHCAFCKSERQAETWVDCACGVVVHADCVREFNVTLCPAAGCGRALSAPSEKGSSAPAPPPGRELLSWATPYVTPLKWFVPALLVSPTLGFMVAAQMFVVASCMWGVLIHRRDEQGKRLGETHPEHRAWRPIKWFTPAYRLYLKVLFCVASLPLLASQPMHSQDPVSHGTWTILRCVALVAWSAVAVRFFVLRDRAEEASLAERSG